MRSDALSRDAVLEVLQGLIRTPSVNPALALDEPAGEEAIVAYACEWLTAHDVEAWQEEAAPGRPNAVGSIGDGNGPTLVLCAHIDTVSTAGMAIPPFDPRVEGNRVYGRGSYDMKGGAAACMAAAAALADEPLGGKLMLALVCDEEYASIGASDFVRRHHADACILTEPSTRDLVLAHKGFVWLEVTTHGKAAHGSRWDIGESAIGKMGRIIAALEEYDKRELRARVHPLVGPASMHCALVNGGTGLSTYSELCTLGIERRTVPGETPAQVIADIERVIRDAGETADVRITLDRAPLECDPASAVATAVRNAATRIDGRAPAEIGVAYWMDAAIFAAAGLPTVDYGASGAGAPEAVEWVDLDSVVRSARVLVEAARDFFGSPKNSL